MARELSHRLLIKGFLVTKSPLHVGGPGDDVWTDMPLARSGLGHVCIPGTSLAGAFRSWLESAFGSELVRQFAGFQEEQEGRASSWIVEDVVLAQVDPAAIELRQGVGINRRLGSAHPSVLYDRAVLPRGTRLPLEMSVEVTDKKHLELARGLLGHLLEALKRREVPLGAARSRGLGRVRLVGQPMILEQDFSSAIGMLQVLSATARERGEHDLPEFGEPTRLTIEKLKESGAVPKPSPRLEIEIAWKPRGPLMVKADDEGLVADAMPQVGAVSGATLALILPGSSIKGVLRSCAERIVRTVLPWKPLGLVSGNGARFQDDIDLPLVTTLFGLAAESGTPKAAGRDRGSGPEPGLAALWVDDCLGEPLTQEQWAAITSADSPGELTSVLESSAPGAWTPAYHVAVDRWTGGAADGALFCVLEPWQSSFQPIRMTLDLKRLRPSDIRAALALLCLVIRELARGRLPMGFAVNRGMGDLEVLAVSVVGRNLGDRFARIASFRRTGSQIAAFDLEEIRKLLDRRWKCWISLRSRRLQRAQRRLVERDDATEHRDGQ